MTTQAATAWNRLHELARFRPAYPSESVVRFVARRFGGLDPEHHEPCYLLDIGCGAGRHSLLIAQAGHRVSATDISEEGLAHTRRALEVAGVREPDVHLAPMTALPFASDTFDGVVAFGVFNYGNSGDFRKAVTEAHRVLKQGGRALVVTRTTADLRTKLGSKVEPKTVLVEDDLTNEAGMLQHFLDRRSINIYFAQFVEVIVDRIDHTDGGGQIQNSDWVIEAVK